MRKAFLLGIVSLPFVLTILTPPVEVRARSEETQQTDSTKSPATTEKGSIVIRTAQEHDFPSLATVSLQQAIHIALTQVPARLLKAETKEANGILVHHVEVVATDKTITEFTIDAGTGAVLTKSLDTPDDDKKSEREDEEEDD